MRGVGAAVRSWNVAKPILIAGLIGSVGAALLAAGYVKSGVYDVGAAHPHTKFTQWLTHDTMVHSVRRRARSIDAPAAFTPRQVADGLCDYEAHCVACHGAAGVARQQWAAGMEPAPPYLLDVRRRFSRAELFWIVRNGIKMTGMPAWNNEMSVAEAWSVVAWLEASTKLPPQTYARWLADGRCGGGPAIASGSWPR
jgi:mono/diheme cytochrome c family protein